MAPGMAVAIGAVQRALALLPLFAALVGCAATRPTSDLVAMDAEATRVARLERLGQEVATALEHATGVRFATSSRDGLGAWSWPDGRIRASRRLVDLLDDDELRAALAHEVGHLVDGGHVAGGPLALSGSARGGAGVEERADLVGCRLLRARGASAEALPRMLRRVAAQLESGATADDPDPAALRRRAAAADAICTAR